MFQTPYFILENEDTNIDNLSFHDISKDEHFIKINLIDVPSDEHSILNTIIESLRLKYPDKIGNYDILVAHRVVDEIQNIFINIDIIFTHYEKLSEETRRYINNLVRVGCRCSTGKLLFTSLQNSPITNC